MEYIYFSSIFMAAVVHFLMAMVLFLRRKEGERSRLILAALVLVSVFNYAHRIVSILQGDTPSLVVSVPMLILAIFMVTCYILYPVEVVSPGSLNAKRLLKMYAPIAFLITVYGITLLCGVTYEPFGSLADMLPHASHFNVWFRLLLSFLIFSPLLFIFLVPHTQKYNNTDTHWMKGYSIAFFINNIAYIAVLSVDNLYIKTSYYFITVGCEFYILYQELFVRLIAHQPQQMLTASPASLLAPEPLAKQKTPLSAVLEADSNLRAKPELRSNSLFAQLETYMQQEQAWRDPDINMRKIVVALGTNRTTLAIAIQEQGLNSFIFYVNKLRIDDFIQLVDQYGSANYQDIFFEVGYRSKTTALRNFRLFIGTTPSEYFVQNA